MGVLLGLLGGTEVRIHSYGVLLRGEPGDSGPAEAFREAEISAGGWPGNSVGPNPRVVPTAPVTEEAAGGA